MPPKGRKRLSFNSTFYERIRGGVCQCDKAMSAESQETNSTLGCVILFGWCLLKENISREIQPHSICVIKKKTTAFVFCVVSVNGKTFLEKYNSIPFVLLKKTTAASVSSMGDILNVFSLTLALFSARKCASPTSSCVLGVTRGVQCGCCQTHAVMLR